MFTLRCLLAGHDLVIERYERDRHGAVRRTREEGEAWHF